MGMSIIFAHYFYFAVLFLSACRHIMADSFLGSNCQKSDGRTRADEDSYSSSSMVDHSKENPYSHVVAPRMWWTYEYVYASMLGVHSTVLPLNKPRQRQWRDDHTHYICRHKHIHTTPHTDMQMYALRERRLQSLLLCGGSSQNSVLSLCNVEKKILYIRAVTNDL